MENIEVVEKMEKELYVAAMKGNVEFLNKIHHDEYLKKKSHEKNNIFHVAIRHEQREFIEACLGNIPSDHEITREKNSKGNTPLHIAAEVGSLSIVSLLYDYLVKSDVEGDDEGEKPWRMQNSKGNTPVHVAIIHDNVKIARFLLDKDPYLARIVNNSKEAPLHLAIKHHFNYSESESITTILKQPIAEGGAALMTKFVHGEDMSSMIYFLVEKGSCVTCWPDENGLTPLHRAASLGMPFNIEVIRSILYHFPQSAEVCDTLGNSILHLLIGRMPSYLEGKNLLKFKEIFALRNYQDQRGNTPLHIAARSKDINMVRVLLEFSTKLSIKNKEGISVASLIQQHNLHEVLRKRKLTPEECKATNKPNISFLRERMSKLGEDFLLSQDSKERNVLHRLMEIKNESHIIQDDFIDFVQQILEKFPKLVCQTDVNGDTPIHILVRNNPDSTIYVASGNRTNTNQNVNDFIFSSLWRSGVLSALLELCNQCNLKIQREESVKEARYDPPWLVQNALGNTPLHEALIANNHVLVRRLLALDRRSAGLVNKCKETPLHLIGGRPMYMEQFKRKDIELMVEAKAEAAYWPDQDGLTPILRAFQVGDLSTATILCSISPEAAKICDANDQSFWHLLVNHPSIYYVHLLLQNQTLRELLGLKDKNGDTPLHLAIQENRFDIVQVFLDTWERERESSRGRHRWLVDLLDLQNKAGKTPSDLIAESPSLPPKIEKSIGDKYEMIGVRSMWGIPTSQMKTYVNTMGIIAALLTTITFTAAFAVPGGLIENVGTPVLIERVAFQVFMISDELAMCLSMMVLFCLLWIMATNNRHNSVKILDFSVTLLLASFYATIVTFMTGLFATLFSVKPWTAIVTLVLCSLLMLLVHKYLVIKFLIPFKNVIRYFFWMFLRFARKICTKIIKWCTAMARKFIGCCKPKPSNGADGQGRTRQRSVIIV